MIHPRFTLREPNGSKETSINIVLNIKPNKFVFPLKIKIKPKYWDKSKQRVKNLKENQENLIINNLLDRLDTLLINHIYNCIVNCEPLEKETIRTVIKNYLNPVNNISSSFFPFIDSVINDYTTKINNVTGRPRCNSTIKDLRSTYNFLKKYELSSKEITFNTITLDWYYDFVGWCNDLGYSINNIGKHIKNLKIFMNEAIEKKITTNTDYKSKRFNVLKEDVDNIYLSINELNKMYNLDLTNKPKLELARDLFLIGSFTGLRVSDWYKVKFENIKHVLNKSFITIDTQKTGERVTIPLNPIVISILKKWSENPPIKRLSNQAINLYIKEVGRLSELTDLESIRTTKGGLKATTKINKYKLIKTHTARRSFCTNAYLSNMDTISIMKISGHKSETSFMKYIKLSSHENALKVSNNKFFEIAI